jgi:hypothetical protein
MKLEGFLFLVNPTIKPRIAPRNTPAGPVMNIPSSGPWLASGVRMIGPIYPSMNPVNPTINVEISVENNIPKNYLH